MQSSALLLCLGFGLATSAQAAELGWYVIGFGGESSASTSQAQMDDNLVALFERQGLTVEDSTSTLDDSDTGFGVGGGYQLNDYFAFEFAYVDLGKIDYQADAVISDGTITSDADVTFESSADGPVVSVLAMYPFGERFSVFARAGISFLEAEGTARITVDGTTGSASQSGQKSDPMFGVGAEFGVTKHFAVRLGWDRYLDVGTADVAGDTDADVISLGLRFAMSWFR
jgi:OOP family OmpA-OmpF porin